MRFWLDPDPGSMNTDPKHWIRLTALLVPGAGATAGVAYRVHAGKRWNPAAGSDRRNS